MFSLSSEPLPMSLLEPNLASGAFVTFIGRVRDLNESKSVKSLEYEAFDSLALVEGSKILEQANQRFSLHGAGCVHRVGHLALGDAAIVVEVCAAHRQEAFKACGWIVDEIKARVPIWKKEHYENGASDWLEPKPVALSESEYYDRQTRLSEVGPEGQQRLRDAKVLVIGAGGLGCAALPYLAAAGVGEIGVCDPDTVQLSNLSRQVLFTVDDLNRPKCEVVVERLSRLNPFVKWTPIRERFGRNNGPDLVRQFDLVLECTDSLTAKFDLNEAVVGTKKAAIIGGIYRYEGQIQAIFEGGACLGCLWPEEPEAGCVGTCAEVGVLGVTPAVIGSLQACESLKWILGMDSRLFQGSLAMVDLLDLRIDWVNLERRKECTICGMNPESRPDPLEVFPTSLTEYRVVDIREEEERIVEPFPYEPGEWMPLSTWTGEGLDQKPTLFVCHRGARSLRVVKQLRDIGFPHTYSLPGGTSTLKGLLG